MKKFLKVTLVIVALVVIAFFTLVLPKTVSMIEDYPRYTFEYVTEDTAMVSDYAIGTNRNPGDYGYSGFEEVDYTSLLDDTQLNGWYVAATKDSITRTLVISHGRTANRLKTMKYLSLITFLIPCILFAQEKEKIGKNLDSRKADYSDIARQIWDWAELGNVGVVGLTAVEERV